MSSFSPPLKKTLLLKVLIVLTILLRIPIGRVYAANCSPSSTQSVAPGLTDMVGQTYSRLTSLSPVSYTSTAYTGGLYSGSNTKPYAHDLAGYNAASQIQPLNTSGSPASNGKIILLSVGMSNVFQEFEAFKILFRDQKLAGSPPTNSKLSVVNGAAVGQDAEQWLNINSSNWTNITNSMTGSSSPNQVQIVWLKQADANPDSFPTNVTALKDYLITISQNIKTLFPNTKIIYISSRARSYKYFTGTSPEPSAFETGLSAKAVIEDYINGNVSNTPYITWGPYLWDDDWSPDNLENDCTHPSDEGEIVVGQQLLDFFNSDSTSRYWFTGQALGDPPEDPGSEDTTPPVISITPLSPDPTDDATPSLTGTATDADGTVASVQFQIDSTSGAWSSCVADDGDFDEASETFSCTSATLANGEHTMYIRALDNSGNTTADIDLASDTFTVDVEEEEEDVDLTPPNILLLALAPDPTADNTLTITGTASDIENTVANVQFQMDSLASSWVACTADDGAFDEASEDFSCTAATLADGTHTMYVRATDNNGNTTEDVDAASDTFTVTTTNDGEEENNNNDAGEITSTSSKNNSGSNSFKAVLSLGSQGITTWLSQVLQPEIKDIPDLNDDGVVDSFEYYIMMNEYGTTACGLPEDIDDNCVINTFDFSFLFDL